MRFSQLRCVISLSVLALVGWGTAANADDFTTWTSSSGSSTTGSITTSGGPISVSVSITNSSGPDLFVGVVNSSSFGTFNGTESVSDVYSPTPPGTSDFTWGVAGSDSAIYTMTFSSPVTDPVFEVYNVDFRSFSFLGGVTPDVLSGLNLVAGGSSVGDNDPSTYDNGGSDPNKGDASGSAYGSFEIPGTFSSLQWTRPLGTGAPSPTDGYYMGLAVDDSPASTPEPGSWALLITGSISGAGLLLRRRLRRS